MSKIIITGPTGNAGSAILSAALQSPEVSQVTVLSRRQPFETHEKLTTILIPSDEYPGASFENLTPAVVEKVKDHNAVIWAQGISQTQVDKDEYFKITHDYPLEAAKQFQTFGSAATPFRFIYVSGEGVDQNEKSRHLFSRVKGRAEREIHALETPSFQTLSIRPGGILPTKEHSPRMSLFFRYGLAAAGILEYVYPSMVINADKLGVASVNLALGRGWQHKTEQGWIGNPTLRKLSQL